MPQFRCVPRLFFNGVLPFMSCLAVPASVLTRYGKSEAIMIRFRRTRSAFLSAISDALLPLGIGRFGAHFVDPPEPGDPAGGAAGGGNDPGAGAGDPEPVDPAASSTGRSSGGTYPAKQYHDLDRKRKKFTLAFRAILKQLGVENPEQVKIRQTSDPANPIVIEGIDDLDQRTAAARMAAQLGVGTGRGRQPAAGNAQQLQLQVNAQGAQIKGLLAYIKRTSVIEPIRAACVRYGAIDDDGGRFSDIVNILAPRFRPEVEFDPEHADAEPTVRLDYLDEAGNPFYDPNTGLPPTPDSIVSDFLTKRPKYRKADWRGGPGAGGAQVGAPRRNGTPIATSTQRSSEPTTIARNIGGFFGLPVEEVEARAPRAPAPPAHSGNGR